MVANRTIHPKRHAVRFGPVALIVLVSLLLSGCGSVSIFNAPAPLASTVTIPYSISVGSPDDGLAALNGRDGSDAWHSAVGEPSIIFAPIMVNGIIYTEGGSRPPGQSTLVAVRASDGRMLWRFPAPVWDFSMATDGVIVLVAMGTHGLYALDAVTGALRWQRDETAISPRLYVKDGIAIATITDTQGGNAHLSVYQEEDGKPLWQLPDVSQIGINHTAVYTSDSNEVLAYVPQSGKEIWHGEMTGKIFAVNDQSVLISDESQVISLDPATGRSLWSAPAAPDGWSGVAQTPTLVVYGTNQDEVIALSASDGSEQWRSEFPGYAVIQVTEVQGVVFALLTGAGGHKLPRVVALNSTVGSVYWMRESSEVSLLISNLHL